MGFDMERLGIEVCSFSVFLCLRLAFRVIRGRRSVRAISRIVVICLPVILRAGGRPVFGLGITDVRVERQVSLVIRRSFTVRFIQFVNIFRPLAAIAAFALERQSAASYDIVNGYRFLVGR